MKLISTALSCTVITFACVFIQSCSPEDPGVFGLNFDGTTDIEGCEMTRCTPSGNNCKKVGDHNVLNLQSRQSINIFYSYASTGNARGYFENENGQSLFSENDIPVSIKDQIIKADYKVRITRDSAILFIRDKQKPSDIKNVIFAVYRDDLAARTAPCN
jgi:hypothetical protein